MVFLLVSNFGIDAPQVHIPRPEIADASTVALRQVQTLAGELPARLDAGITGHRPRPGLVRRIVSIPGACARMIEERDLRLAGDGSRAGGPPRARDPRGRRP